MSDDRLRNISERTDGRSIGLVVLVVIDAVDFVADGVTIEFLGEFFVPSLGVADDGVDTDGFGK